MEAHPTEEMMQRRHCRCDAEDANEAPMEHEEMMSEEGCVKKE